MRSKLFIVALLCAASSLWAQELLNYPLDTINGEEVYRYEVERSIGLYRIGVNFNVPQSEIVRLNPQLRERGLHYGETLYLPTGRKVVDKPQVQPETVITIDTTIHTENIVEAVVRTIQVIDSIVQTDSIVADTLRADTIKQDTLIPDPRRVVELALLLPFESQQSKRSTNAERMMEFYQGALLALKNKQNDSTLYRLRVYDSERSERVVRLLCDSTELDSVKGILGLVYPIQIERMAEWCALHQVPLLVPFSSDLDLANRPQVLQFNSTDAQQADSIIRWITERDSLVHCVSLSVREADITESMRVLRKQLKKSTIVCQPLPLHDLMVDSAAYALDTAKENVIFFHSDRFQHVRVLLPHLTKLQQQGYRIRLVSQYAWQKETIDLPQLYTCMFHTEADRSAYEEDWSRFFVSNHVSDAPRFDLLGYDLMQALVGWIEGAQEHEGLQSRIRWTQVENGGWQNAEVRVEEK